MKKLRVFGLSIVDPKFFNSRVLKIDDKEDDYHFTNIFAKSTGITDYKVTSIPGAGNDWITSVVINQLDDIDENTIVVVNWATMDRFDFPLSDEQNKLQHEIENSMPPEYDYLRMNRTFNVDAVEVKTGLRWWPCSHFYFGPKMKIKDLISYAGQLKHWFEKVALIQALLKSKGATQIHLMQCDAEYTEFRSVLKEIQDAYLAGANDPKYRVFNFKKTQLDLYEKYPELLKWRSLVDWSLFCENQFDFFSRHNIPFVCTDYFNSMHQPPINNYIFVKEAVLSKLKISCNDLLEEMKIATEDHCRKYNCFYDWDEENIRKVIS
jgi:hypothetical protein